MMCLDSPFPYIALLTQAMVHISFTGNIVSNENVMTRRLPVHKSMCSTLKPCVSMFNTKHCCYFPTGTNQIHTFRFQPSFSKDR